MQARQKVVNTRVSGMVVEMKGKFGWIQPDAPINHPEGRKRGGKLYLSVSDFEGGIPNVSDKVSFFVYSDGTGLGAMNCKKDGAAGVQKPIGKPETLKPGGMGAPAGGRTSLGDDALYMGKIQSWNGSHGWILPIDTITHPLFKGKIYLKASDYDSSEPLTMGMLVSFFLYTDAQGLGAEHCTVADPDASMFGEDPPESSVLKAKPKGGFPQSPFASTPPPSPDADGPSVLKAKPKMAAGGPSADTSVLKAKPKMAAGSAGTSATSKATTITLPAHLTPELAQRLVAWMWDRGG